MADQHGPLSTHGFRRPGTKIFTEPDARAHEGLMSRAALFATCIVVCGCDPDGPAPILEGSTGTSAGVPSTTENLETSGMPDTTTGPAEGSELSGTTTGLETSSESTLDPGTTSRTTSESATTTGSDSGTGTTSGTDTTSGGPDPIEPANTVADIEWVTSFVGAEFDPTHVRSWNGSPTLLLNTAGDVDLVLGEGLPSQTTVATPASSVVALVVFDDATGAVASTQVLFESSTPEVESSYTSTALSNVAIDDSGALIVVGGWTGTTTFFPGTPDATTRDTLAVGFPQPDLPEAILARFDSAVMRIEPDGSAGWLAVSDPPPDGSYGALSNYPQGVALFANGDPLVSGTYLSEDTSFPAGSPDAYFSEGNDSFFVRPDHLTGGPAWIGLADTSYHAGFSDSAGGALYIVLEGQNGPSSGTYFAGTPNSITLPFGDHITRLDPDGGLEWAVPTDHQDFGGVHGVVARTDGLAVLGFSGGGTVTLEGAHGATATTTVADVFHPRAQWFARIDSEGSVLALQPLPEALRIGHQILSTNPNAMVTDDDGVWYGGYVFDSAWFDDDEIPELSQLADTAIVVIHVNDDGLVDETHVLGYGFDLDTMAWADEAQTRLLVSARYRCSLLTAPGLLVPGASEPQLLPVGCPPGSTPRRGFVASVNLGG